MKRCVWFLALCLCVVATGGRAEEPLPLALIWNAPDECPTAEDVRAELARIARARPGHTLKPLTAYAEVKAGRNAQGYNLSLTTDYEGRRGERQLSASSCRDLVRTLTLVLALTFGAGVEVTEDSLREPQAPETAPAEPEPTPPPPAPEVQKEPAPRRQPLFTDAVVRFSHFAGGGVQLGLLPRAGGALTVGSMLAYGPLSFGLRATLVRARPHDTALDVRTQFDGLGGALRNCLHGPLRTLDTALCAGLGVTALRGRSTVQGREDQGVAPYYAVQGALAASWPRGHWVRVGLEATLGLSLNRPSFVIEGLGRVHRVPTAVPDFALMLLFTP